MIIKLLSIQIPEHWELIKFCATKVDQVKDENLQLYLNDLLHALLNGHAQCWVRLNDKREVATVMITRITPNKLTGEKYLWMNTVYSFRGTTDDVWEEDREIMKRFAKQVQCSYIYFRATNKRVRDIAKLLGCEEEFTVFALKVG